MQIRLAEYKDLESISAVMLEIFESRMQEKYSDEGKKAFRELISLSSLQKRFLSENLFYISMDGTTVKGVLELEKPCHIAFLFVKQEGKGLGTKLCYEALDKSTEALCTVGAIEESIGFYEHLGFMQVAEQREVNDMSFTLMAKVTEG